MHARGRLRNSANTLPSRKRGILQINRAGGLTEEFYREKIQPRLSGITVPAIASALGLSRPYAAEIRAGRKLPHPRHWEKLAKLVGVAPN